MSTISVLVVDDEPTVRMLVVEIAEELGYLDVPKGVLVDQKKIDNYRDDEIDALYAR